MSDRRESGFTLHPRSGLILHGDPLALPNTAEDIPDSEWRELGSIDPVTGANAGRLDAGEHLDAAVGGLAVAIMG